MNKIRIFAFGLMSTMVFIWPAFAVAATTNTVKVKQGNHIVVEAGSKFTVELIGENFLAAPDGAAFALAWDPTVLSYVSTSVANPPWDTSYVSDNNAINGVIDYLFLGKSVGDVGTDFSLASFTFNVVGNQGLSTDLSVTIDPYTVGFVTPGGVPIDVTYLNSQVSVSTSVVPIPPSIWLFGSALLGISASGRVTRMKQAGVQNV
jgi:hypothetical protein